MVDSTYLVYFLQPNDTQHPLKKWREKTFKNRNLFIIRSLFILLWVNIPRLSTLILVTHDWIVSEHDMSWTTTDNGGSKTTSNSVSK